jgi:hypothetical protein
MTNVDLADDLIRGAREIAQAIYGKSDRAAQRRLYNEQEAWGIFQLKEGGPLYALRSRLRGIVLAKAAEKEARIAAAAQKAAVVKSRTPVRRRRRHQPQTARHR